MEKIKDSLYGFVVGDALGVPVEFSSRQVLNKNPVTEMKGYGSHYVPAGVWSDDTSMTLATMDSIINTKNINYNDMADRFCSWLSDAKYTATNKVFDVGVTVRKGLHAYTFKKMDSKIIDATKCGMNTLFSNGNGSLMRILPIAFFCYSKQSTDNEIYDIVKNTSSITHAHEISIMGCYIYVQYVINLLKGNNKNESYKFIQKLDYSMFYNDTQKEYERIIKKDISALTIDEIESTGYVVSSLEASLWSLLTQNNLKDTILTAVNLGGDTDTIGAITGSLAGIVYSYDDIPKNWVDILKNKTFLDKIISEFQSVFN